MDRSIVFLLFQNAEKQKQEENLYRFPPVLLLFKRRFNAILMELECYCNYPKLSYIIESESTPKLSNIFTTALLIGPGPHM